MKLNIIKTTKGPAVRDCGQQALFLRLYVLAVVSSYSAYPAAQIQMLILHIADTFLDSVSFMLFLQVKINYLNMDEGKEKEGHQAKRL